MEENIRESGRYKMNEEDKAKPVPLKLHQSYIERLKFLPGKNNAETIRLLIDRSCDWLERERRQVKEIKRLINPLYRQAKLLVDPTIKDDLTKFNREINRFQSGLKSLETLLDLLHFDFSSLKPHLTDRDIVELEIIFAAKQSYL